MRTSILSVAATAATLVLFGAPALAQNLPGTPGPDHLVGTGSADQIHGGKGADVLEGRGGRDLLDGGAGPDVLVGGTGGDFFRGGRGADVVRGGPGNDQLETIQGKDVIHMGRGDDSLSFLTDDGVRAFIDCGSGHDVVNYLGAIDTADVISKNCDEVNANTSD